MNMDSDGSHSFRTPLEWNSEFLAHLTHADSDLQKYFSPERKTYFGISVLETKSLEPSSRKSLCQALKTQSRQALDRLLELKPISLGKKPAPAQIPLARAFSDCVSCHSLKSSSEIPYIPFHDEKDFREFLRREDKLGNQILDEIRERVETPRNLHLRPMPPDRFLSTYQRNQILNALDQFR